MSATCDIAVPLPNSSVFTAIDSEGSQVPSVTVQMVIEEVAKIMEHREKNDVATIPAVMPKPIVRALFVGPFVLDTVLQRKATLWEERLAEEYGIEVDMHVAEPPFQTDDVECKGYWLKPDARVYEQRVKKLKSQVCSALIILLTTIERVRPRIIVGEGQGGVVAAMSTFPVI